jgi:amidase
MARTVAEAWTLLTSIAEPALKPMADYAREFNIKGLRLGVARKHFGFNERVDKLMDGCLAELKKLGVVLVDPADIPTSGKFDDSEFEVLLYEFKADLNAYLAGLGPSAPVRSLKDIIDFNEKNRAREMPYFGQDIMIKAQAKGPLTTKAYREALRKNQLLTRSQGIDLVLKKNRLAALVAPTGGPPWPTDWINGDHFAGGYSSASAVAGYPHITVPAGYVFGLPVGISFFGAANSEPVLAQIAWAFEQATKARKPPRFLEKAEFG